MANSKAVGTAYSDPALTDATITDSTISGGTLNNATVGATTPLAGTFTTLTATGKFGANGKTAVSAAATVAAVSTGTLQSGFGFSTSAQLVTAITAINSILTALKNAGIMAE